MHKFCLRLIAAYKWSIVALEKSLSPQGHPSGIWTQESLSPNGPPPRALPTLLGSGLASFIKLRARGHSRRLLCESSLPNARLFIAACSSLRNSHRLTAQSWLLSRHPAAAGPLTDPRTHAISKHKVLCKPAIGGSSRRLWEVERKQRQVGRVEGG